MQPYRLYKRRKAYWIDFRDEDGRRQRLSLGTSHLHEAERRAPLKYADALQPTRRSTSTLEVALERWIDEEGRLRGKRPLTIETYLGAARGICRLLGAETPVETIDTTRIRDFQRRRLRDGVSPRTVNLQTVTLLAALRYAGMQVKSPGRLKVDHTESTALTEDEVGQLLDAASGTRMEPVLVLALETGLRRAEVANVRWRDVDLSNRMIHVPHTKSRRERAVGISSALSKWLKEHRTRIGAQLGRIPGPDDFVAVFLKLGHPRHGKQWCLKTLTHETTKLFDRAGVRRDGIHTLHRMRKTFASLSLCRGASIYALQKVLGHATIGQTEAYLSADATDVKRATEAGSSLARRR